MKDDTGPAFPRISIGLAGWANPPGRKTLRPEGESHLEFYADRFSCVEINSSFYRSHRPATYLGWRRATPRSFKFSVKLSKAVTHECALRGARRDLKQFFDTVEPLGEKLGAVLIQLPPSLIFDSRAVRAFFKQLPELGKAFYACEPRHASWFDTPADDLMKRFGIARVAADPARVAGAERPGGSTQRVYFRWHGSPRMYYSSYAEQQIDSLAKQVAAHRVQRPWCIFDNTARYAAWDNAERLSALLRRC